MAMPPATSRTCAWWTGHSWSMAVEPRARSPSGTASRRPPGGKPARASHRGTDLPQLREKLELQRLGKVGHPAGTRLVADDALDRLQVMAAPQLEVLIQVDQPLGELVQVPVLVGVVIDPEPGAGDLFAGAIGQTENACEVIFRNLIAAAAQEEQHLVIE